MFLHFTDRNDKDTWINSAQTVRLQPIKEGNDLLTTIFLSDGSSQTVKEDPQEVADSMNRGMVTDHVGY